MLDEGGRRDGNHTVIVHRAKWDLCAAVHIGHGRLQLGAREEIRQGARPL
jgi:hypothetical protein